MDKVYKHNFCNNVYPRHKLLDLVNVLISQHTLMESTNIFLRVKSRRYKFLCTILN
jgi:hypothetical protein